MDILKPVKTMLAQPKIISKLLIVYAIYLLGFWGILKAYWWTEQDVRFLADPQNLESVSEPLKGLFYQIFSFSSAAQDIFPLPQFMGLACLSIASLMVLQVIGKSLSVQNLILSACIGLNPYLLPAFSGHFDMFPNALALLCAVVPFLYWGEKPLTFFWVAFICLGVCITLCPVMSCLFVVLFAYKIMQDYNEKKPFEHLNLLTGLGAVILFLISCWLYEGTLYHFIGKGLTVYHKGFDVLKNHWLWTPALAVRPGTPEAPFSIAPSIMGMLMIVLSLFGIAGGLRQVGRKSLLIKMVCWAVMLGGVFAPVMVGTEPSFAALGLMMFLIIQSAPSGKAFDTLNALFLGGVCLYALHNSTPLSWKATLPEAKKTAYVLFWVFEVGFTGALTWGMWHLCKTYRLFIIGLWWVWSCLVFFIHYGNLLIVQKHFIVFKLESALSDLATFPYHNIKFSGQDLQNPIVIEKAKEYPLMGQLIRTKQNEVLGQYVRALMVPYLKECQDNISQRDVMPLIQTPGHSLYLLNDSCVVIRLFNAPDRNPHKEY